jgi:putative hemolysin
MDSYELSYASPEDPLARRLLMRAVENLSGRRRLLPVYEKWKRDFAGKSATQWSDLLKMIGSDLEVSAAENWIESIPDGPLVLIANHPFGIADGIAVLSLAEQIRRPYRILLNADFMRVPEVQPLGLPIDFSETKAALERNLKSRAEARRLLKEGVTIIIFPAGGVATSERPFGKAEELPWKLFTARLIQKSSATVLPVFAEGQNSPLFHFVSRYSLSIRLGLLVSEFRHRVGKPIQLHVGMPIRSAQISAGLETQDLLDELYLLVHRLNPENFDKSRESLLPRRPEERYRFPWDPPSGKINMRNNLRNRSMISHDA